MSLLLILTLGLPRNIHQISVGIHLSSTGLEITMMLVHLQRLHNYKNTKHIIPETSLAQLKSNVGLQYQFPFIKLELHLDMDLSLNNG